RLQREREIDGGGRFADAALSRRDRDDVLHAGDELHAPLHRVRHDLLADVDGDASSTPQRSARVLDELADDFVLALRWIAELDLDADLAVVDAHALDRLFRYEILARVRIDHGLQGGLDVGL